MTIKKYEFTKETIKIDGITLHRIRSLIDIPKYNVKKGDLGGFIEKEENLSHEGLCWVFGNAKVSWNARVSGNAWVSGDAEVFGNAQVYGNACVFNNAQVFGNAWVYGNACVYGDAHVSGFTRVYCDAQVYGNACVYGDAWVYDYAEVYGNARVCMNARVYGGAKVIGDYVKSGDNEITNVTPEEETYSERLKKINLFDKELDDLKKEQKELREHLEDALVYMREQEVNQKYAKMRDKLERCLKILEE